MSKRETSRKKRRQPMDGKKPVTFMVFVLVLLIGVVSVQISNLCTSNMKLEKDREQLEQQIEQEVAKNMELLKEQQYLYSEQHVEKLAREKLGLIKEGEILFITKY